MICFGLIVMKINYYENVIINNKYCKLIVFELK